MNIKDLLNIISKCCDDDLLNTTEILSDANTILDIEKLLLELSQSILSEEELYGLMVSSCIKGSVLELENHILIGRKYHNINLDYDDSCLAVIAANRNYLSCLNVLKKYGADMKNPAVLGAAALHGHVDIVLFLLNQGANPIELLSTASYNNYSNIKAIFDEHIRKYPKAL
jgi:hypothetical protein